MDFIKIPSSKPTEPSVRVLVQTRWLSLVLRLKLILTSFFDFLLAKSLTKVVFPVPLGPIMRTNKSASYALFRIYIELFQSR